MTEVIPFRPEHVFEIKEQDSTAGHISSMEQAIAIAQGSSHAYTIRVDGKTLLCGGVFTVWENRGEAWAILEKSAKPHFVSLHKASKKFFDECPVKRIEASIPVDFKNARRWIKHLGFELEVESRRAYRPDGSDWSLYARVK